MLRTYLTLISDLIKCYKCYNITGFLTLFENNFFFFKKNIFLYREMGKCCYNATFVTSIIQVLYHE